MPLYEHVFLAPPGCEHPAGRRTDHQMTGIVEQAGGKVVKMENWGVRSLTYRMNKNRKAHFVLLNIDAPSAAVSEIERQERISEDVIRYLTVRVEEHEEGPSAMMRKADRDRGPRRPRRRLPRRPRGWFPWRPRGRRLPGATAVRAVRATKTQWLRSKNHG